MNQITENLWIGDIDDARNGDTGRFDLVVTVCEDSVSDNVSCPCSQFKLADGHPIIYDDAKFNYDVFERAAETVHEALDDEKTTLVHCHVGQSRSAAVCMAVVGARSSISFEQSEKIVERARPIVNPIPELREYARQYIKRNS